MVSWDSDFWVFRRADNEDFRKRDRFFNQTFYALHD
jgi:hypothetical protein